MSAKKSAGAVELADADYDELGWPIGTISIAHRTYDSIYGPQASWIAEYHDLPGYLGFASTIDDALMRLRQDLGTRPHFRVAREKPRTLHQWQKHIGQKHSLPAAAAGQVVARQAKGLSRPSRGSDGMDAAAKAIGRRKEVAVAAMDEFEGSFGQQADGKWSVGDPVWAAEEMMRVRDTQIELELLAAERTPWLLERDEARKKFPTRDR